MQREVPVEARETAESLYDKLAAVGALLLVETVDRMKQGNLQRTPQDHSKATLAPTIKKEEGRIEWKEEAIQIDRRVRAFDAWPGAFTHWEGRLLKIRKGEVRESKTKAEAGTVTWVGSDFAEVAAGTDSFLIREIQLEGGKRMSLREFLHGHPIAVGTVFK